VTQRTYKCSYYFNLSENLAADHSTGPDYDYVYSTAGAGMGSIVGSLSNGNDSAVFAQTLVSGIRVLTVNGSPIYFGVTRTAPANKVANIDVSALGGNDTIDLSAVDPTYFTNLVSTYLTGDTGNDSIIGSPANDVIDGGSGDDVLSGGNGNDSLYGGTGNDDVSGNAGNDYINTQSDGYVDTIHGDAGDSILKDATDILL
jgi:Ca2+-binding RTX toxin-like protein